MNLNLKQQYAGADPGGGAPPLRKKRIGVTGLTIYIAMCMCSGYMCII
jgi:hypothetical protein